MKIENKTIWSVCAVIVVILFFVFLKTLDPQKSVINPAVVDPTLLPGIEVSDEPWAPEIDNLRARLNKIGLPALTQEGTALHIHQHLDIFIHGKKVEVPSDIGVNEKENFIASIHTHDLSSVIHVESPTVQDFTLGQFFDIWGLRFTDQSIGGYVSDSENKLKVFVNGIKFTSDPRNIVLSEHQEIVVTFGIDKELPNKIPASYLFGADL